MVLVPKYQAWIDLEWTYWTTYDVLKQKLTDSFNENLSIPYNIRQFSENLILSIDLRTEHM